VTDGELRGGMITVDFPGIGERERGKQKRADCEETQSVFQAKVSLSIEAMVARMGVLFACGLVCLETAMANSCGMRRSRSRPEPLLRRPTLSDAGRTASDGARQLICISSCPRDE